MPSPGTLSIGEMVEALFLEAQARFLMHKLECEEEGKTARFYFQCFRCRFYEKEMSRFQKIYDRGNMPTVEQPDLKSGVERKLFESSNLSSPTEP